MNMLAKECQRIEVDKTTEIQKVNISLKNMTKGVYFIEATLGDQNRMVKKVLIY